MPYGRPMGKRKDYESAPPIDAYLHFPACGACLNGECEHCEYSEICDCVHWWRLRFFSNDHPQTELQVPCWYASQTCSERNQINRLRRDGLGEAQSDMFTTRIIVPQDTFVHGARQGWILSRSA